MKKKMRRFQEGGIADENFTADQLKFLGGADRTDPYILARMRNKFPDEVKGAPITDKSNYAYSTRSDNSTALNDGLSRDETGRISDIQRNPETGELYSTKDSKPASTTTSKPKVVTKPVEKPVTKPAIDTAKLNTNNAQKTQSVVFKDQNKNKSFGPSGSALLDSYVPTPTSVKKEPEESLGRRLRKALGSNYKDGGKISNASKRADGCAVRGKTRA